MKTIIFDMDDTLYDQLIPFEKGIRKNFESIKIPIEDLYHANRAHSDAVFGLTESGEMSLEEMHAYRIMKAFETFNQSITKEEALLFQKDYRENQEKITLLADVKDTLTFCQDNEIPIGLITNGPEKHQQMKIAQLGLTKWFQPETIFISSAVGFRKPDKRIFQLVQDTLKLTPEDTFYVGDSFENDMVGAKNVGWQTIWCNRRNKEIPGDPEMIDYMVTKQQSLFAIVEEIVREERSGCSK